MTTYQKESKQVQRGFWVAVILTVVVALIVVLTSGGCAENQSETRLTMETLRDIAESGNVEGDIDVYLSGVSEAGMKEGVYFGSPGTTIRGKLKYRFSEKPTTQPVKD